MFLVHFYSLFRDYVNLDEKVQALEEIILDQVNRFIPHKNVVVFPRDKVWFSEDLRQVYKDKIRKYKIFKKYPTVVNNGRYDEAKLQNLDRNVRRPKMYILKK